MTCLAADDELELEGEPRLRTRCSTNSLPSATTIREGEGGCSYDDGSAYTVLRLPSKSDPCFELRLLTELEVVGRDCMLARSSA